VPVKQQGPCFPCKGHRAYRCSVYATKTRRSPWSGLEGWDCGPWEIAMRSPKDGGLGSPSSPIVPVFITRSWKALQSPQNSLSGLETKVGGGVRGAGRGTLLHQAGGGGGFSQSRGCAAATRVCRGLRAPTKLKSNAAPKLFSTCPRERRLVARARVSSSKRSWMRSAICYFLALPLVGALAPVRYLKKAAYRLGRPRASPKWTILEFL
jgi:hypothetical protein